MRNVDAEEMGKNWLRDKENDLRQQADRAALAFARSDNATADRVAAAYRAAADALHNFLADWENERC